MNRQGTLTSLELELPHRWWKDHGSFTFFLGNFQWIHTLKPSWCTITHHMHWWKQPNIFFQDRVLSFFSFHYSCRIMHAHLYLSFLLSFSSCRLALSTLLMQKSGQHTECTRMCRSRTDQTAVELRRPVQQPGQTGFLGSFERENYHAYVMEDG